MLYKNISFHHIIGLLYRYTMIWINQLTVFSLTNVRGMLHPIKLPNTEDA